MKDESLHRNNLILFITAGTLFFSALFLSAFFWLSGNSDLADILLDIQVNNKLWETVNQRDFVPPDGPIVIPFRYGPEGTMLVPVQLGKRQVQFIFDTGSSICTLWKESVPGDVLVHDGKFLGTHLSYCNLPDTRLGGIFLGGSTVKVERRWCRDAQNSAGLLGGSLFKHFDVTIDYAAKQIILSKHVSHKRTSPAALVVPFHLTDDMLWVHLTLGTEKTVDAVVDTGCLFNSISVTALRSYVKVSKKSWAQFNNMKIGDVEFNTPIFEIDDGLRPGVPPLIGNGTLSQYRTTIDFKDSKLILEPRTSGTATPVRTLSQAFYHLVKKEYKTAVAEFTDVIKTEPELGDLAYGGRAECFAALKSYKQATDDYSKLLTSTPAWAYSGRGYMYQQQKMYQKSSDDFSKSISLRILPPKEIWLPGKEAPIFPENSNEYLSWLYSSRAWNHVQLDEYRKAINDYTKSIELKPGDPTKYSARAWCYDILGYSREAVDDYSQAIRLSPKNADAYMNRARSREKLKEYQAAIDDYSKAIALQPKTKDAYYFRSLLLEKTGRNDLATKDRPTVKQPDGK